jgi:protocatechuate 3,4-dioxygenase beta subunit
VSAGDLEIDLRVGASLSGRISDAQGPVAEATVQAYSEGSPSEHWRQATTDANGNYRIRGLATGRVWVTANAEHHVELPKTSAMLSGTETTTLDLVLERAALVTGSVVDPDGKPVSKAKVSMNEKEKKGYSSPSAVTKPDGTFSLDRVPAGPLALKITADDFLEGSQTTNAPASGIQITLRRGATVSGIVTETGGTAVAKASIEVKLKDAEDYPRWGNTDPQGHFRISGLTPGVYEITANYKMGGSGSHPQEVTLRTEDSTAELQIQLDPGLPLAGKVLDSAGQPVAKAAVFAEGDTPEQHAFGRTDESGAFRLEHVPAGNYRVRVSTEMARLIPESGAPEDGTPAHAGDLNLVVIVKKSPSLHGRVVREDGTPVTTFMVNGKSITDEGGLFSIPLSAQLSKIVITADDLAGTEQKVTAKEDTDMDLGDVVLKKGRELRGRVIDAQTSQPVAGALVDVGSDQSRPTHGSLSPRYGAVQTGADGRFVLPHVDTIARQLLVDHPQYAPYATTLGSGDASMDISLQPGASVSGHVLDRDGKPHSASVIAQGKEGLPGWARALSDGAFQVTGLAPGSYSLVASDSYGTGEFRAVGQIELTAGTNSSLDLQEQTGGLAVTLNLNSSGWKARRARPMLVASTTLPDPQDGRRFMSALYTGTPGTFSDDGTAVFSHVNAGQYTLVVVQYQRSMGVYRAPVNVPESDGAVTLDVSLPQTPELLGGM